MKPLWKTKTFWVGILSIAAAAVDFAFGDRAGAVNKLLIGIGLICGRDAIRKVEVGK